MTGTMSIIFVFIDGIGLTNATAHNPFGLTPQPYLSQLVGGPLLIDHVGQYPRARLSAIDATLDWRITPKWHWSNIVVCGDQLLPTPYSATNRTSHLLRYTKCSAPETC
jgi:hypothetical protein